MIIKSAWMPDGRERPYQMCVRCVMDTTDPAITFDADGICSHCHYFEREIMPWWPQGEAAPKALEEALGRIRKAGRGKRYDCVIGISGGVDSSFLAAKAVDWGLRPLAIHVDAGWNSELAVRNIELMVTKLKIDLQTVVVDWEEMRDLQLAFLRANVANQDIPQDHAFTAAMLKFAVAHGVRYVVSGSNYATESILPQSWGYDAMDLAYIKSVHGKYGSRPLRKFPTVPFLQYYVWMRNVLKMDVICPLNFIPYDKSEALGFLEREFGWRYYGGKHYESRWTRFYQAHYLPEKFGYDKRKAHQSSLIVTGQMTREEALRLLEEPLYTDNLLAEDKAFVAKKLGVTVAELEAFIAAPCQRESDFATHARDLELLRRGVGVTQYARRIVSIPKRLVRRL